ncbi:MAG: hypothetical protein FD138_2847 [Planctomycetota bacterium]|nr:MAG: hypothetical protein FD138_2847 [Planctomycetota bacterium]
MPQFLTVKEAATLTGKSASSIRRVIYPIIQGKNHPDRQHIEPTEDDATKLRLKGENFAWRISEELLRREIPMEPAKPAGDERHDSQPRTAGDVELLAMLRRELDIKNQQITQQSEMLSKQMELISGLSERLREGNILIGSLQKQLTLTDGSHRTESEIVDAKSPTSTSPEKGSDSTKKKAKPKKGFFLGLFR